MGNDSDIPQNLIVGETINPPGNWSSSPPHKHDVDDLPMESKLEEVYFYKLKPQQGFGLQRIYSDDGDLDEAYVIRDGDTVAFPRGYHPVVAAPGYQLYYLWVLAGEKRIMCPNDDPDHAWVKDTEPIISEII
jgi:5-deoxy-glucuronate isomerase